LASTNYKLRVDWNNDGDFGDTGEAISSGRIRSIPVCGRGRDQPSQLVGKSSGGNLQVILDNRSGDYSSYNTSSPLTGNVLPGRRIRLRAEGHAAQFTVANSEFLSVADNASLSTGDIDFTLTAWVYLDSTGADRVITGKWNTTGNQREYLLYYDTSSDRFIFSISSNGTAVTSENADVLGVPATGTWYFIVAWHDAAANTLNIQVNNGTADSQSYSSGGFDSTAGFSIGSAHGGAAVTPWNGRIVMGAVWKKVLSAAEKTLLYNDGDGRTYSEIGLAGDGSALKTNLQGWWELDAASGSRADSQGSNTLTDNNTVTQALGIPNHPIWAGFLLRLMPQPLASGKDNIAVLDGIGALGWINQEEISLAMRTSETTDVTMGAIFDETQLVSSDRDFDTGKSTLVRYWADKGSPLAAAREIEEVEAGFLFERNDGKVAFRNRHARLAGASLTSQATFSDAAGAALPYTDLVEIDPWENIFNAFEAEVQLYTAGSPGTTLWTLAEVGANSIGIGPSDSFTWWGLYPNPVSGNDAFGVSLWITPVVTTDFTFNSAPGGGGTDISSDMALVATAFGNRIRLVFTNNHASHIAYVQALKARGTPITADDTIPIREADTTSQAKFGNRTWPLKSRWMPNTQEAHDWATYHLGIYKDEIPHLMMVYEANRSDAMLDQMLKREIGDRITVKGDTNAGLGIDSDFFIENIKNVITDSETGHKVFYLLSDAESFTDFWVLDTSKLDTQTRVAY